MAVVASRRSETVPSALRPGSVALHYGDWFVDNRGSLYIVPAVAGGVVLGPRNEIRLGLDDLYRSGRMPEPQVVERRLRLRKVPHPLRRFSTRRGYYAA